MNQILGAIVFDLFLFSLDLSSRDLGWEYGIKTGDLLDVLLLTLASHDMAFEITQLLFCSHLSCSHLPKTAERIQT